MPENISTLIPEREKLLGLDYLRAFAIIIVFLYHYQLFGHPAWEQDISKFGWTGVDLFFVLSGFLIAGQLFDKVLKEKNIQLRDFFLKRFFRILPAYLVVLMLYFFFSTLRENEPMAPLWRYLSFTLNFGLDLRKTRTFTHSWSLCIEEQFYLVLPLTILLFNYFKAGKRAIYLFLALFIGCFITRILIWDFMVKPYLAGDDLGAIWHKNIYYPTYCRLDGLLIGVAVAGLFTFYPNIKTRLNNYSHRLLLTGMVILIASYIICKDNTSFNASIYGFPLIAFAYALILMAVVSPSNVLYNLKSVIASQLATLSYSIYLIHKIMIHSTQNMFEKLGIDKNSNLMFLLCIASSLTGALLLRYAVEKPALKIRDMLLNRLNGKKFTL
jgi:peptidoglycan/LPS O-acetylase OafA/YrhL